ncbi:MAG: hypothetical protein RL154_728, partial [Pseudomonadota bacterium]
MKKVLVILAEGFEELELVASVDVMRRAELGVVMAAVSSQETLVKGAHGITIAADTFLESVDLTEFDALVLPGGFANAKTLSEDSAAQNAIKTFNANKKLVAAICAAPIALFSAGVLDCEFTCYPGCEEFIKSGSHTSMSVVSAGNIITSKGPGTAICFGI